MDELALRGGKPVRDKPLPPMYPGAMFIDEDEEESVLEVLRSKSLFRYYGPNLLGKVDEFERRFAEYMNVRYSLGVTSGTAALYVALRAIGVGPGDEVIVPAYTWISTPAVVAAVGATPVVAGIDDSLLLDPEDLEEKITDKTKAVIPVHMRGSPCDMENIMRIAEEYGLKVVEDTAQACGGTYKERKLGSIGDIGAFSFQLNKIITSGEGGAIITNDEEIYKRAVAAHDVAAYYRRPGYIPPLLGLNFRMNEITAAILLEQLKKIDRIISIMRKRKREIIEGIADLGLELKKENDPEGDAGVCVIFYLPNAEKARLVAKALNAENINAHVLYRPDAIDGHICRYWLPLLDKKLKYDRKTFERALDLLGRAVHIDVSPLLTEEDVETIIKGIRKVTKALL